MTFRGQPITVSTWRERYFHPTVWGMPSVNNWNSSPQVTANEWSLKGIEACDAVMDGAIIHFREETYISMVTAPSQKTVLNRVH